MTAYNDVYFVENLFEKGKRTMGKDYSRTARTVLECIGGEKNVKSVTHCMTRLRFRLEDETIVDDKKVKAISGVAGVVKQNGQYQIIIGNDVGKCYAELLKLGSFKEEGEKMDDKKKEKINPFMAVIDVISGCMTPIIPAIIGGGIIKVLLVVLGFIFDSGSQTMQLLNVVGDGAFYFLPLLVAYTAAKKFNTNPYLVVAVVGVLIHPDFIDLLSKAENGVHFLGLPVTNASYSSSIIPAILTAWVMSYIERFVDKITPAVTKNFLKSTLIILISAPISFIVLAPLGYMVGNGLASVVYAIQSQARIPVMIVMCALTPFIVMTGMHWAFTPMAVIALATPAGDALVNPMMLASNLAQGAACAAVALKSKNKELKQTASAASISALLAGVTEPGIYGVTLPLKKPMIAACIASGIVGAFDGIVNLTGHAFAVPSLVSLPQFISADKPNNFMYAVIAAGISIVCSFVLTWIIGFDDPKENGEQQEEVTTDSKPISEEEHKELVIPSPVSGKAVALEKVNDSTFAEKMLGDGVAVIPVDGKVYAPFDGEIVSLMDSGHAVAMRSDQGVEVLVHMGLDTVEMHGEPFTIHVKEGKVTKGTLILEADLNLIRQKGYDTITPIIIANTADYKAVNMLSRGEITALEPILEIVRE